MVWNIIFLLAGATLLSVLLFSAVLAIQITTADYKRYAVVGVLCILASGVVLYTDIWKFITFSVLTLFLSFAIGYSLKKGFSLYKMMAIASTGVVVIVGVWVIFCMNRYKTSAVWVIYGEYFTLLKELAAEVPKIKNQLIETVSLLQQQIDLMLPSMVIVGAMFLSYIVFQAVRIISEKQNVKVQIRHFYELRLNKSFTVIFLIVDLIAAGMVNNIIALNVSSVIYVIFTVCGVSVIDFYLQVMGVPTVLRVIIYIAAVVVFSLLGPIGTLIANIIYFVGMIDSFRPLRHFPEGKKYR